MRRASVQVIVATAVALSAPTVAVAADTPLAGTVVELSTPIRDAEHPRIVVAADGTATAIWEEQRDGTAVVQAATRPSDGAFGPPVQLSVPSPTNPLAPQSDSHPEVAVSPDGTTFAVWQQTQSAGSGVQVATRPPGGSFGPPVTISAPAAAAYSPALAVGQDGTAVVTWSAYVSNAVHLQSSTRASGGVFEAAVDITATGQIVGAPATAVGPDGTTTIAWQTDTSRVQTATRPAGGNFGPAIDLGSSAGTRTDTGPSIAAGLDGTTAVVWSEDTGSEFVTRFVSRAAGGSFGAPESLSPLGRDARRPQIALAQNGSATVTWMGLDGPDRVVVASRKAAGGTFATAIQLSLPGASAFDAQVRAAWDGAATVVWSRYDGANVVAQGRTLVPGGELTSLRDLSPVGRNADSPQVAVAPDGTATALWSRFNGSKWVVQAVGPGSPTQPPAQRANVVTATPAPATQVVRTPEPNVQATSVLTRPLLVVQPKIVGTYRVGRTLRCATGQFTGATQFTIYWRRNGRAIRRASGSSYRLTRADRGHVVTCKVDARSSVGHTTVASVGVVPG